MISHTGWNVLITAQPRHNELQGQRALNQPHPALPQTLKARTFQISVPILVAVLERPWVDLVHGSRLPPVQALGRDGNDGDGGRNEHKHGSHGEPEEHLPRDPIAGLARELKQHLFGHPSIGPDILHVELPGAKDVHGVVLRAGRRAAWVQVSLQDVFILYKPVVCLAFLRV